MTRLRTRTRLLALFGAAPLLLAGCSLDQPARGGMMGSGPRHAYASSSCAAPTSLPGSTVRVLLADMGMMGGGRMGHHMRLLVSRGSVSAGAVSLVATNAGWRKHELVVLPLAAGAAAGERVPGADGRVDETGSLGEASASCAGGTGEGITPGAAGWVTLKLAPGRYELVCNLRNHYANGMYAELVVR